MQDGDSVGMEEGAEKELALAILHPLSLLARKTQHSPASNFKVCASDLWLPASLLAESIGLVVSGLLTVL